MKDYYITLNDKSLEKITICVYRCMSYQMIRLEVMFSLIFLFAHKSLCAVIDCYIEFNLSGYEKATIGTHRYIYAEWLIIPLCIFKARHLTV